MSGRKIFRLRVDLRNSFNPSRNFASASVFRPQRKSVIAEIRCR